METIIITLITFVGMGGVLAVFLPRYLATHGETLRGHARRVASVASLVESEEDRKQQQADRDANFLIDSFTEREWRKLSRQRNSDKWDTLFQTYLRQHMEQLRITYGSEDYTTYLLPAAKPLAR